MKRTRTETTVTKFFCSIVLPDVETQSPQLSSVIEWADKNPIVWKIVTGTKSASFGKNASTYFASARGDLPGSILARAVYFKGELERDPKNFPDRKGEDFWAWRARFTLEHYNDKGFKGGFFQQYDGTYPRGCAYLDYTPETRDEVIKRFLEWCDQSYKFPTREVWIAKKVVQSFPE